MNIAPTVCRVTGYSCYSRWQIVRYVWRNWWFRPVTFWQCPKCGQEWEVQ